MRYLGMRFDSPDVKDMIAELAQKNNALRVILRLDAIHIWEYDRDGNIVKADAPEVEMSKDIRRVYCVPEEMSDENRWVCVLYDENNKGIAQGVQTFPR